MPSLLSRFLPRTTSLHARDALAPVLSPSDVVARLTQPRVGDYLAEEDVSNERLLTLFKQAFMVVEASSDGGLAVTGDNGVRMRVSADADRRLISIMATFGLSEVAPTADKLALCNRVNDAVIFVRLSVLNPTTLCCDHHLPFDGGISAASIVASVRRLARISVQAIGEMDRDRVVS